VFAEGEAHYEWNADAAESSRSSYTISFLVSERDGVGINIGTLAHGVMLSHGNICRAIEYLSDLRRARVSTLRDFCLISRSTQEERIWLERFCEMCRLTRLTTGTMDALTERGRFVADGYLEAKNCSVAFRQLLAAYIENARPGWGNRMPAGRSETFSALTKDEYYCFQQAGLTQRPASEDVVFWWDHAAAAFRNDSEARLLETGREGERLTLRYERERTGRDARWESVESNFSGYDILSSESASDATPRLIEVKTTTRAASASTFFISRNEWDTAVRSANRYWFYLWQLNPEIKLAKVPAADMAQHLSQNQGRGAWCSVEIPFSAFSTLFGEGGVSKDCNTGIK